MAIFSVRNYVLEDADVELPLDVEVIEKDDVEYASEVPAENEDPLAVAGEVGAQMESNWNEMMMAIGMHELKYMQENGHEVIYEGVDFKSFKNKVVTFFETLKKKIKAVVENFAATLKSRCLKGEKFISKYSKDIEAGFRRMKEKNSDKEIKMYTFANLDWTPQTAWDKTDGPRMLDIIKGAKANTSSYVAAGDMESEDSIRGKILYRGKSGSISSEDFDKSIREYFMGDEEKKSTKISSLSSISEHIDIVKTGKSTKKIEKAWKEFQKPLNDAIKAAKQIKEFNTEPSKGKGEDWKDQSNMNKIHIAVQRAKFDLTTINQVFGGFLRAHKARYDQSRSICLACVYGNNKVDKKLFGESAGSTEDFLSNVQFV